MARFIEFKGLKHYSLGNTTLNVVKNELEISGIRDTGSDGVLIEIPQGKNWQVEMQPVKIEAEKLLNICYRGIDQIGRLKTFGEIVYGINPANNKPSTALNSWLLSEKIKLKATLNDKIVYDKTLDIPPKSNWLWLAAAAAIWVWKGDGHVKFQTGDDGTNFEAEITFGQKSSSDGTEGNRVTLFTGEEITADSFSVTSLFPYEKGTPESHIPKISNILITGINLDSIRFKDESYEK